MVHSKETWTKTFNLKDKDFKYIIFYTYFKEFLKNNNEQFWKLIFHDLIIPN